jgi:acetylornithine deacetylase
MKSFFALVIEAIRDLPLKSLRQPLTIIATADEESDMCGAKALKDLGRRLGRQVVIGEPTNLRPIRSHKGIGMERIRLVGQAGHSSNPALGNNALEGMHLLMGELLRWRDRWQERWRNPLFEVPMPTLNLGHIHGGDNPNRICGECELHFDIRLLPGMELDGVRAELREHLTRVLADSGLAFEMTPLFDGMNPMETPAEAVIVRTVEEMTGHQAGAVAFGTEGPYFAELGLDALILGAGSIDQAHQPDEYLALGQIEPAVQLLRRLVKHFCW